MKFDPSSKLCQNLLIPQYNDMYVRFAKLKQNIKKRREMLDLARQAQRNLCYG